MITPPPGRTREQLSDALTIHGAEVLRSAHAADAVLTALRHAERRGGLRLADDATSAARDAYLSFVGMREEVLQFTSWDGTERRAA